MSQRQPAGKSAAGRLGTPAGGTASGGGRAADILRECREILAARRSSILREAIGAGEPADWQHCPPGEIYDPVSHAQFFYHRHSAPGHPTPGPGAEHGHFHLFLRAEGMPQGVFPLVLPEIAIADAAVPPQAAPLKRGGRDEVAHLIAIALDSRGEPVRLFTTNRWVTGETWYRAEDMVRMLVRFTANARESACVLQRWVGAVVRLYEPQIASLIQARDEAVMAWRRKRRVNVFEDTRLEITSSLDIDLDAELDRRQAGAGRPGVPALPCVAEGWGA